MIAWLHRLIGPTVDYDTYWRVLHMRRREKKLAYWQQEMDKRSVRLRYACEMVAYYYAAQQENRPDALRQEGANVTPAGAAPTPSHIPQPIPPTGENGPAPQVPGDREAPGNVRPIASSPVDAGSALQTMSDWRRDAEQYRRIARAVEEHNRDCVALCDGRRRCGYEKYAAHMSCTNCPKDWIVVIE